MVTIKTPEEIAIIREGGHKLAKILKQLLNEVKPGTNTADLESLALKLMAEIGAEPSFKGYPMGGGLYFPTALCISIDDEVVHGTALPNRVLAEGEIVDIDIGMRYPKGDKGLYTDMCKTVGVGKISKVAKKLIEDTEHSLKLGIRQVKAGKTLNDIGKAIQDYAEGQGYGVVRDLVGHGVGYEAHEAPHVFNYAIGEKSSENLTLKAGMVLAIEPMINLGTYQVKTADDGLTVLTTDGSLSAHFEHTVVVTDRGCEILTNL